MVGSLGLGGLQYHVIACKRYKTGSQCIFDKQQFPLVSSKRIKQKVMFHELD